MLNKSLFKLISIVLILFLAACAPTPSVTTTQPQKILSWPQRQAQLSTIHNWTLSSAFSVRDQQRVSMASLTWQQQGSYFTQRIAGPFNLGGVLIKGTPGQVTLIKSANEQYSASSPEALLQEQLNLRLPISNLYYWIRGIPVPGVAISQQQFDQANHLVSFRQSGWQINYLNFTTVNGIDLPSSMQLTSSQLQVKIVIKQWQI